MLAADPDVAARARILRVSGMVSNARVSTIFAGIGQDVQEVRRIKGPAYEYDVVAGTPLWQETRAHPLVLGQAWPPFWAAKCPRSALLRRSRTDPGLRPMRCCPPGPLELTVSTRGTARINATQALPTGIMDWGIKEINDRLVVMPMAEAQALLNTREISEYHVLLADGADLTPRATGCPPSSRPPASTSPCSAGPTARPSISRSRRCWAAPQLHRHRRRHRRLHQPAQRQLHELRPARARIRHPAQPGLHPPLRDDAHRAGKQLAAATRRWSASPARWGVTRAVRAAKIMWTPPGSSNAVPVEVAWVAPVYVLTLAGVVILARASAIPTRKILRRPIRSVLSEG